MNLTREEIEAGDVSNRCYLQSAQDAYAEMASIAEAAYLASSEADRLWVAGVWTPAQP